jgi:hypothetical protein
VIAWVPLSFDRQMRLNTHLIERFSVNGKSLDGMHVAFGYKACHR